jgi:phenylacetate-CoA ligase
VFGPEVQDRLLAEVRRAALHVPAYRVLLDEQRVSVDGVVDFDTFVSRCPLLSRRNTFARFDVSQLSVGGQLADIADVLTSSGHEGQFSFGVTSRREAAASAAFVDTAMDAWFGVRSRPALLINCLPMGVVLSSGCMTVATTSVREDMAVALVQAFGDRYEQIILVGDPLFMKRLTDHAADRRVDWRRFRVNAIVGEEIFGEHFREYVAQCFGLDLDHPESGYIMSSLGVAELGLNLGFETPATIALRRLAVAEPAFARDLLGRETGPGMCLPMIFSFDPGRTFIEIVEPDDDGYGRLTVSMLDPDRSVPLLRYQTGDVARLLDPARVAAAAHRHGVPGGEVPAALLALRGRDRESLPNGSHVGFYKDAVYANRELARQVTGAVRLVFSGSQCTVHVQLVRGQAPEPGLEAGLRREMKADVRPVQVVLWSYAAFPYGMGLDYERKFRHYVPEERDGEPAASVDRDAVARSPVVTGSDGR